MISAIFNSQASSWNVVERLVFPAPRPSYSLESFPGELIIVPGEAGDVPCLFLPFQHARFLMIFFHANAEDLGLVYNFCSVLRDLFQVNLLAVEYPGYGACPGVSSEWGIMRNAEAAMKFAINALKVAQCDIIIFGRSLGTGPAVALAAKYDVAGLVLVSPFTSIKELFQRRVGRLATFLEDRFDNLALSPQITSPTLIIHGMQDVLVPPEHGRKIYDCLYSKRMLVTPSSMTHNSSLLRDLASFVMPMTTFFALPDYTFENLQVPDWAFPEIGPSTTNDPVTPWGCAARCCQRQKAGDDAVVEPISHLKDDESNGGSAGIYFQSSTSGGESPSQEVKEDSGDVQVSPCAFHSI